MIVLCEAMLGEFAMMGGRVMVESLLSAHWMSLRPAERAERFERFSGVELVDFADLLVEQGHLEQSDFDLPYIFDPEYRATLRKEFRSSRLGWTQMRWHELVRDVATSRKEGTAGAEAAEELRSCAAVAQVVSSTHAHVGPTVTMGQFLRGESRKKHYGRWWPDDGGRELRKFATEHPELLQGRIVPRRRPPGAQCAGTRKIRRRKVRKGGFVKGGFWGLGEVRAALVESTDSRGGTSTWTCRLTEPERS